MSGDPRHDPCFQSRVVLDLLQHFGEWRPLGRILAPDWPSFERNKVVGEAVNRARRLGFVIEAKRGRGYRLTGFVMPVVVWLVKPGGRQS